MISRRNIRVKVMQTLYALESMDDSTADNPTKTTQVQPQKLLDKHFDQTRSLFIYLVHFLNSLAGYVEIDSRNRASKHLPSQEDLNVNTKLAGNEIIWRILETEGWKNVLKNDKPSQWLDLELLKKLYLELCDKEIYKNYIDFSGRDKKQEKAIIEFLVSDMMLANEEFTQHIEELFSNWYDDGDMIIPLLMQFLSKPETEVYNLLLGDEKRKFANRLLATTIDRKDQAMEYIKPKLKNWDSERIAVLDMILMRLGVCEFLYFETIPPKVTINEYIDLAKDYSTPQSGHFVNGILDGIHKDLVVENKMHKVSYRS